MVKEKIVISPQIQMLLCLIQEKVQYREPTEKQDPEQL